MRLARQLWYRGRQRGEVGASLVDEAFEGIVEEDGDEYLRRWSALTGTQQNVLRAVAMGVDALSSAETLARYALKNSSSAVQAAKVLMERDLLEKDRGTRRYRFDSRFFEAWVRRRTVLDLGMGP